MDMDDKKVDDKKLPESEPVYSMQLEPFVYSGPLQKTQPEESEVTERHEEYRTVVSEAMFGEDDYKLLATDVNICAAMADAVVSDKLRKECEEDLRAAQRRGWKHV
jgi:hypothetical protein